MDSPLLPRCSPETGVRPHETPDPCLASSHCRPVAGAAAAARAGLQCSVRSHAGKHQPRDLPRRPQGFSATVVLHVEQLRKMLDCLKRSKPMKLTLKSVGNAQLPDDKSDHVY